MIDEEFLLDITTIINKPALLECRSNECRIINNFEKLNDSSEILIVEPGEKPTYCTPANNKIFRIFPEAVSLRPLQDHKTAKFLVNHFVETPFGDPYRIKIRNEMTSVDQLKSRDIERFIQYMEHNYYKVIYSILQKIPGASSRPSINDLYLIEAMLLMSKDELFTKWYAVWPNIKKSTPASNYTELTYEYLDKNTKIKMQEIGESSIKITKIDRKLILMKLLSDSKSSPDSFLLGASLLLGDFTLEKLIVEFSKALNYTNNDGIEIARTVTHKHIYKEGDIYITDGTKTTRLKIHQWLSKIIMLSKSQIN